jgi:RNA-directed DNA polymerase
LRRYVIKGEAIDVWSAQDALLIKAMTLVLENYLNPKLPVTCYHIKGRGGLKAAVRDLQRSIKPGQFFMRSDVLSYYASINHDVLRAQCAALIPDPGIRQLIDGFLSHTIDRDGVFMENKQGIPRGSSISPLLGCIYLTPLDQALAKHNVTYVRYMDDWVILADSRWKLRKAIRCMNQTLAELKVAKHPDKTFCGRIEKGINNFLGYFFSPQGLNISQQTLQKFVMHIEELKEQKVSLPRLRQYAVKLKSWCVGGLHGICLVTHELNQTLHLLFATFNSCCDSRSLRSSVEPPVMSPLPA